MIFNDGFCFLLFFIVHSLDSGIYLNITCNCKKNSMRFIFSSVIIHVFDIEIILHIVPNIDFNHIILVFYFGFLTDFINS